MSNQGENIVIEVSNSLVNEINFFRENLIMAFEKINMFALQHEWQQHTMDLLINKVRIFSSKADFDLAIQACFHLDVNTRVPQTVAGIIADSTLLLVSPEVYLKIYPQGEEDEYYQKLIIHELAHALHIRILNGDEEKMGPRWFYEGFAIHAANQFNRRNGDVSMQEIFSIITSDKNTSYVTYKSIFNKLLKKSSLENLIIHSSKPCFIDWTINLLERDMA